MWVGDRAYAKRPCKFVLALVSSAIFLSACAARNDPDQWTVTEIQSPAAPGSGEPYLSVAGDGVYLSWFEATPQGAHLLRFAHLEGNRWSKPFDIARDLPFFVNWADFPSIRLLSGGSLAAHWLQKNAAGPYAYDVFVSFSSDQGVSWSAPVRPHTDRSATEHGFVSLVAEENTGVAAVWLDGRNFEPGKLEEGDLSNEMALMYSKLEDSAFRDETLLDSRVCDCCQTDAAVTSEGLFVVYRDRSESEVRDISYVRQVAGKWTTPKTLYPDRWKIAACPVNGPAIAADGNLLAGAWFTGSGDRGRVQAIFSSDSGKTFGLPARIDSGNPSGRVDVALAADRSAIVSWLENVPNKGAEIRARQVYPDGKVQPPFVIASSSSARASGFPRLIRQGSSFLVAWTQASDPSQIRIVRITR